MLITVITAYCKFWVMLICFNTALAHFLLLPFLSLFSHHLPLSFLVSHSSFSLPLLHPLSFSFFSISSFPPLSLFPFSDHLVVVGSLLWYKTSYPSCCVSYLFNFLYLCLSEERFDDRQHQIYILKNFMQVLLSGPIHSPGHRRRIK